MRNYGEARKRLEVFNKETGKQCKDKDKECNENDCVSMQTFSEERAQEEDEEPFVSSGSERIPETSESEEKKKTRILTVEE